MRRLVSKLRFASERALAGARETSKTGSDCAYAVHRRPAIAMARIIAASRAMTFCDLVPIPILRRLDRPASSGVALPGVVVMLQRDVMPGILIDARGGFFQRVRLQRQRAYKSPRLLKNLGVVRGHLILNRISR